MRVHKLSDENRIKDPKIIKKMTRAVKKSLIRHEESKKDIRILIKALYENYPGNSKQGSAWIYDILPREDVESYIKQGIFVISRDKKSIGLGPNGLTLISMWNTEKLTKVVIVLTIFTIIVSLFSVILAVNSIRIS